MAKLQLPPFDQVVRLPQFHTEVIPESYRDALGHMSFPYYMMVFNSAWWKFNDFIGTGENYAKVHDGGIFALEHHLTFLREINIGNTVSVHLRMVGHSAKRIHYIKFLVNRTQQTVATLSEGVGSHANLTTRRTTPFPSAISATIQDLATAHAQLTWQPPLCGTIQA